MKTRSKCSQTTHRVQTSCHNDIGVKVPINSMYCREHHVKIVRPFRVSRAFASIHVRLVLALIRQLRPTVHVVDAKRLVRTVQVCAILRRHVDERRDTTSWSSGSNFRFFSVLHVRFFDVPNLNS